MASVLDLDIKIMDGKFQVVIFDKIDLFSFSFVRMSDKSSNALSSIVYSAICAESLSIARASNNPDLLSTEIKLLIARMTRQEVCHEKVNSVIRKCFTNIEKILVIFGKVNKTCYLWSRK